MTVNCFAEDSDNLYIGGDFRAFDTVSAQFIVQYNRKTGIWSALSMVESTMMCMRSQFIMTPCMRLALFGGGVE